MQIYEKKMIPNREKAKVVKKWSIGQDKDSFWLSIIINIKIAINYILKTMIDVDICASDTLSLRKSHDNPELVSIRKKLVAPNNILPGLMHRSQLPIHLLPVRPDFESQPGHQMPLADVQSTN